MIQKKQIVAIVSIAVVSCLIGTSMATDGGNPFDMIWEAIQDLQNQIDAIQLIPGPQGPQGIQGPQGEQGPQGPQGQRGPAGFGAPDYDSGWNSIAPGTAEYLSHGLGTGYSKFLVYMIGRYDISIPGDPPIYFYHQNLGAKWELIDYLPMHPVPAIKVYRSSDSTSWEQYRIRIWKMP